MTIQDLTQVVERGEVLPFGASGDQKPAQENHDPVLSKNTNELKTGAPGRSIVIAPWRAPDLGRVRRRCRRFGFSARAGKTPSSNGIPRSRAETWIQARAAPGPERASPLRHGSPGLVSSRFGFTKRPAVSQAPGRLGNSALRISHCIAETHRRQRKPYYAKASRNFAIADVFDLLGSLGMGRKSLRYSVIAEFLRCSEDTVRKAIANHAKNNGKFPAPWECWPPPRRRR